MAGHTDRQGMSTSEAPEKALRRAFDRAYRLRIVEEADRCTEAGHAGELLRREGLSSHQLANWLRQRHASWQHGEVKKANSR